MSRFPCAVCLSSPRWGSPMAHCAVMWVALLALSASAAVHGRHRVSPNQQVWEQIRVNLERKHGIPSSAGTGGQGSKTAAVSTAIESSETWDSFKCGHGRSRIQNGGSVDC